MCSINLFDCSTCRFAAEPDEIVRMLRELRNANLFLQNQREMSAGLVEKLLKLEFPVAERFYALSDEQFNLILRYPSQSSKKPSADHQG